MRLTVLIEISGEPVTAGHITGTTAHDACFSYDEAYISQKKYRAISLSLPLQEEAFSPRQTHTFFEGLLPEGFTRRSVAQSLHLDENDYLSILHALGKECLGAIRIIDETDDDGKSDYELLSIGQVQALAEEGATKSAELVVASHLSLTGASGKVGLYYDGANWYLPHGNAPSTHIVKQSHVRLEHIVTNEMLCLKTAQNLGIKTSDSFIINTKSGTDDTLLFATERYDRIFSAKKSIRGLPVPNRLHQEDFAQALGISSAEKYEQNNADKNAGYLKKMFSLLRAHSADPISDQLALWDYVIFSYLMGNTDNHIKNYSLLYSTDLQTIRLAPLYDVVSTIIYKSGTRDLSFAIGGEHTIDRLTRDSFRTAAKEIGLGEKIALAHFDSLSERFPRTLDDATEQLCADGFLKAEELRNRITATRI